MPNFISEDQIERALVQKLQHFHGFDALDCHTEDPEDLNDGSGRANKREVILADRVTRSRRAPESLHSAQGDRGRAGKVARPSAGMSLVAANQECMGSCATASRWSLMTPRPAAEGARLPDQLQRAGREPLSDRDAALGATASVASAGLMCCSTSTDCRSSSSS